MKDIRRVIAQVCLFFALLGYLHMGRVIQSVKEVPADPDVRLGFFAALFFVPTALLIVSIVLWRREPKPLD
jgi:hypothetical protein